MRSHPRNSPEAAGRLLALVLVSDGHVCRSELDALERAHAEARLGLAPGALVALVQELCEDLLHGMCVSGTLIDGVDDSVLAPLFAEVDDPALRTLVLDLAVAAAAADRHEADGELRFLEAARRHWPQAVPTPVLA